MSRIVDIFKGLKRNFAMATASFILIFLTMSVLGFMIIISFNTAKTASDINQSLEIHVYLDTSLSQSESDSIHQKIDDNPKTASSQFSSKDEQLKMVTDAFGKDGNEIYSYFSEGEESNPLNDVINILPEKNVDLPSFQIELESIPGVESVDYGQNNGADQFVKTMDIIKYASFVVVLILSIVTIFLVTNTLKLTIDSRKKEIEIMRLVGATKGYITFPFAFEGFLFGLTGGTLAFILVSFSYDFIYNSNILGLFRDFFITPKEIIFILLVSQILFGILIGAVSSTIAIRNYLKI